jgi:hypothetical protein
MSNDVDALAKALAELNIDKMRHLTRNLAGLNIEPDLYFNNAECKDNCIWVSTARCFNSTVLELEL